MVVDGARRMLESGEWLVPRVYGELYTYKPALAYWLASIPLRLAEAPSEALLRLPFAACGFVMGLAVLILIGRLAGWRAGLLSSIASVTGVLFLQKSRMMEFDSSLAAGVGVAVAAACFNLSAARQRWGVWLLGYLALAVGLLTKGVPALMIFGPGLLAAAAAARRFRRLWRWRHLSAVLVFAAITGCYLWAVWESAGPAAFEGPVVEAKARGFGRLSEEDLESRPEARGFSAAEDERPGGWLGALLKPPHIWAVFLPWTMLLFVAFRRRAAPGPDVVDRLRRSATGFLVAGTLMLMLAPAYETRYFLPLSVPIGILCGVTADKRLELDGNGARWLLRFCVGGTAVVAAATALLGFGFPSLPMVPQGHRVVLAAAGVGAGCASFYMLQRRGRYRIPLVLGITALCAMLVQYLAVEPYRASKRDLRPQAQAFARHLPADEPVWVLGPSDDAGKHASLFFYLNRPIRAFRPDADLPPAGVRCLVTGRNLGKLEKAPGFEFDEISRAEHVWFTYHLGVCSKSAG